MNVKLTGGLGNQMFGAAFGFSVAKARETTVRFDKSGYDKETLRRYELDAYDIPMEFEKQTGPVFEERDAFFDLDVYTTLDTNFRGYWQSERWFDEPLVRKLFSVPKGSPNPACMEMANRILDAKDSCFIGVRRADYLWPERINYHGVMDWHYYREAEERVPSRCRFFVFTDDIPWAKENLYTNVTEIVDVNGPNDKAWDIWLMSLCKHAIIANSTFHWWGAWLQNNTGTVIAPKKWFAKDIPNEIVPSRWVKI